MNGLSRKRIVVPIDFSEFSTQALTTARSLLEEGGTLHVVHVLPAIIPMEPGVQWGTITDETRIEHAQKAMVELLRSKDVTGAALHIVPGASGNPAWNIVEVATDVEADLIVIPSHGRTGLARLAIGSVAERVARFAKCPVLILRG